MPRHTGLRKTMVFIAILCLTVWLGASLASAIPQTLNYQGYLTDASGTPLDGPYAMTFSVYDSGGTLLWSESHPAVGVTGGVFNVVLGSTAPIGLAFDMPYFLGIQVGADPEMTPRQELTSVGYAYKAQSVETDTLNSLACATGEAAIWNGTSWGCGASGDVTAVIADTGLVNGGTSGDVTVAISPSYRLPQTCGAGQSAIYNGTLWACTTLTDTTLTEPEVEAYVTNGPLDMASGTTVAGAPIANAIDLSAHTSDISNPHNVTASQIGALPGSGGLVNGPMIINATAGTDAVFTESGVDVPSAGAESFEFANTGGGTLSVIVNGTLIINTSAGSDAAYLDNGVEYQSVGSEIFNIRNTGGGSVELQVDGVAVQTGAEQDTLASLSCASGELAIWNGADWSCGPDADTDTLASLTCASGELAIWNGTNWSCGPDTDTDTLATLTCASGEIAIWNGTDWACGADLDTDTDTVGALSCAGGQIAKWSGAAWVCSDDSASTPLDIIAASPDAIINATNTGTGFAGTFTSSNFGASLIANNTGTGNAIYGTTVSPVESAIVGEHALSGMRGHIGGNGFGVGGFANAPQTAGLYGVAESADATGLYVENTFGGPSAIINGTMEINGTLMVNSTGVRWTRMFDDGVEFSSAGVEVYNLRNTGGGSVELQVDGQPVQVGADADTLASLSCAGGELALWNGTGWQCGADADTDTLASLTCASGEIAIWNGADWTCGPDADTDTDTLAALSCASGEIPSWNGSVWACAVDADTDTDTLAALSCASGELALWNGTNWACGADLDTDTDTVGALSCAIGEVPAWNGSAWACAPDADTIASLSCAGGQIAKWSGAAWVCSDDSASTPLDIIAASPDAIINATNSGTGPAGSFASSTPSASIMANNMGSGNAIHGVTASPVESAIVGEHALSGMRGHIGGNGFGVGGFANAPQTAGLYGLAEDLDATGLYVENPFGGAAAIFNGNAEIIGTLMINSTGVRWTRMFDDGVEFSSAGVEIYNLRNTGGGSVELQVDGQPVQVGADADTLASLSCAGGEIALWNGTGWQCGADQDTDTLTTLPCTLNEISMWNGTDWQCGPNTLVADMGCAPGELLAWDGSTWICAGDADTLTTLPCTLNEISMWNGTDWQCGLNTLVADMGCAPGELLAWDGSTWICAADADKLASLNCSLNEISIWNGTDWMCGLNTLVADMGCTANQVLTWNGSAWVCAANVPVPMNLTGSGAGIPILDVRNSNSTGMGIYGENTPTGSFGIVGEQNIGVYAESSSGDGLNAVSGAAAGDGVFGYATNISGTGAGVYGRAASASARGVSGQNDGSSRSGYIGGTYGAYGQGATAAVSGYLGGSNIGVYGTTNVATGYGVIGEANASTSRGVGGINYATDGYGVWGLAQNATGVTYGVYGMSQSATGYGVYGQNSAGGVAVYANGSMQAVGNITSGGIFTGNGAGLTNIKYSKVAIVATSGGNYTSPVTAMTNLATWCGTPSAANPCMVKIMPGMYSFTAQTLTMQPYVDIEGSGRNVTIINGTNGGGPSVNMASYSEIRDLTVVNLGSGAGNVAGIQILTPKASISRVDVALPNSPNVSTGVLIAGTQTGARLTDVKVNVTGITQIYGVRVSVGDVHITSSDITSTDTASGSAWGLYVGSGTKANVDGAIINSTSVGTGSVYGVYVIGAVTDLNNLDVTAQGASFTGGVYVMTGAEVRIANSRIKCMPGSVTAGYGLYTAGANVRISDSVVTGPAEVTGYALYLNTAGMVYVSGSKLSNGGSLRDVYVNGGTTNKLRLHGNEFGSWPTISPSNPVQRTGGVLATIYCNGNFGSTYTDTNAICYDDL